ncbi:hypothetical protein [Flagellimonas meridianipacifica]|uniref:Uncharacterized protein n=1 Tax=Flagellimonas meridianipacifica TaxID=1080225 RepID=A0A2T0MIU6_9FLAO|nr:hypothetical protein [Allomuricauda pacifica]PRX57507.1 hypothetical protein CLV81_1512 [Allomuricauda pacifica]
MEKSTRRQFVIQSSRLLAFLPFVSSMGCISDHDSKFRKEDSLKRLIYIIGPWTLEDKILAEDFAIRFIKSNHADKFLPKSVQLIQSLSKQMTRDKMAIKEINLANMPKEEQDLLMHLSKQLYSFVEVRLYISKEPPWGQCINNSRWHTRIPK